MQYPTYIYYILKIKIFKGDCMKNSKFVKSTFILIIGGLITKILGMVIKIITTRLIGTEGIGLYMLITPTFTLLIALSQLGFPIAISKLVSEGKNNNKNLIFSIIPLAFCSRDDPRKGKGDQQRQNRGKKSNQQRLQVYFQIVRINQPDIIFECKLKNNIIILINIAKADDNNVDHRDRHEQNHPQTHRSDGGQCRQNP